jgi:hypothetical protein
MPEGASAGGHAKRLSRTTSSTRPRPCQSSKRSCRHECDCRAGEFGGFPWSGFAWGSKSMPRSNHDAFCRCAISGVVLWPRILQRTAIPTTCPGVLVVAEVVRAAIGAVGRDHHASSLADETVALNCRPSGIKCRRLNMNLVETVAKFRGVSGGRSLFPRDELVGAVAPWIVRRLAAGTHRDYGPFDFVLMPVGDDEACASNKKRPSRTDGDLDLISRCDWSLGVLGVDCHRHDTCLLSIGSSKLLVPWSH